MRMGFRLAMSLALLAVAAAPARAFEDYVGTRSLGMGGALRAVAAGDSGPLLNPSGMSLVRAYTVEGAYARSTRRDSNFFHGSIIDSTSGLNLAGGLYYTYQGNAPDDVPSGHGHEVGGALALPLGEYVALGSTLKYFRLSGDEALGGHSGGLTFDVGATIRPVQGLMIGLVGTNLYHLTNDDALRTIGYGLGFTAVTDLILSVDGRTMLDASLRTGHKGTSIMGGGEYFLFHKFAFRLGGGHDAINQHGYLSAGFSAVSEIGALDVGVRRDLFGVSDGDLAVTVVSAGFRLFVPQP